MSEAILVVLIIVPFLAGLACLLVRSSVYRSFLVISTVGGLAVSSQLLQEAPAGGGKWAGIIDPLIAGGDFLLLAVMFFLGCRYRHPLIIMLTAGQLVLFTWLHFAVFAGASPGPALFAVDALSLTMVRVVCLVGGLICLHAIPYMQAHERRQPPARSRQPQFFAVLLLFLGAMNGLVLTNHLAHFYFFFELTTLCSYLLIRHDHTEEAVANALTALWMNGLGGLLLLLAIRGLYSQCATLDMNVLAAAGGKGAAMLPLALLLLAACTKSAQLPWQKWLLGAMVAPTPTSALLHSSTMVKAGVYLALRFAPAFAHTMLAQGLILAGGFTFVAAAALAIGQRNAKKVLAYSTISNLGLIFACAGIGTPAAVAAGILLILFHAVSKGLLFLCIGTAEQQVHSRDLEVMRGLCASMPVTAMIAVLGVLTLIVPPFGMLLGKWLVFEAGADHIVFYLMMVLGSACTLLYWVRLAGTLLAGGETGAARPEAQPLLTRLPLAALAGGAVLLGLGAPALYGRLLAALAPLFDPMTASPAGPPFAAGRAGVLLTAQGAFPMAALFLAAVLVALLALAAARQARAGKKGRAYLAGANTELSGHFLGPMNRPVRAVVENYYLTPFFGEERWTPWVNLAAAGLLLFMLGGGLWA
jgi:ech hydrogenase subunit A